MEAIETRSLVLALACAFASVVATILLLPALSAIPRAHWKGPPVTRIAIRVALASGLPALAVATGILRVVSVDDRTAIVLVAAIGTAVHVGAMAHRYAPMRRLRVLVPRLAVEATRASAVAEIERLLDRTRPAAQSGAWLVTWVSTVLNAAEHLANAGELEAAGRSLDRLAGLQLSGVLAPLRDALRALIKLHLGEREAAAHALAAIARPAQITMVEAMVVSLESLVRALDGRHAEALSRLARWGYPEEWHVRSRLVARAHALSASGDEPGARRALHEIERRFGQRGLEVAARVDGPASELARSIADRRTAA